MPKLNQKGIVQALVLLILVAGLGASLYLSRNTLVFNPKAFEQKSSSLVKGNVKAPCRRNCPTPAPTPTPTPLPGLAMVFDSNRTGHFEIYTETFSNLQVTQLTNNANYDAFWPRLSPDRTKILFYRTPVGVHDTDFTQASLWLMNADGNNQHVLIAQGANNWPLQGHAEWSSDGTKIIMATTTTANPSSYQIWTTDSQGLNPTQVTNRVGINLDPSFKRNTTSQFLFIGCPTSTCGAPDIEVYLSTAPNTYTRLTTNTDVDYDPYFSYGNTQIAWLKNENNANIWNIWVMNADGTNQHRVTTDGASNFSIINSKPEWSTDNAWIFFHRFQNNKWDIWQIHPDGTGLNMITTGQPGNNEYPSF